MKKEIAFGIAVCVVLSAPRQAAAEEPSKGPDPCTLVDKAALAGLFGELKEGPTPGSGLRNERQCDYTNMTGSWIKFSLYSGMDRWEWEKGMANAQNPKDLAGLGDEAFAIKRGSDSVVYVRKGESILELSCSCSRDVAEKIARKAAGKL